MSLSNLLSIQDLDSKIIWQILHTADEFKNPNGGKPKKVAALNGKTVINLFFEDSTRTRISFETAAKNLGADLINFSAKGSSVSKGESLKDTAQTLKAIGGDIVVMRHWASGAAARLANANWIDASIVNAGDGTHEHPTQALLDVYTIWKHFGDDFSKLKIGIVGDILHSRVARSNLLLLSKLGAQIYLIAPRTLLPMGFDKDHSTLPGVSVSYSLDAVLPELDVIMELRIQQERMEGGFFPSATEFSNLYGLRKERLSKLKENAIILHPGPMNRGLEIDATSADSEKSKVLEQVQNGVLVRMAVLFLIGTKS